MEKPRFDIEEIKVEVKGLSTIEENISIAKDFAINLKEYYSKLVFNKDDLKLAKEEKAQINKIKDKIDEKRKAITKQFNEPLEKFINDAKETRTYLEEAYNCINNQVIKYEQEEKDMRKDKLLKLFNEHIIANNLETLEIPFESCGVNITLSASDKSLEDKVIGFVERVAQDIQVIKCEEYSSEILQEYLKNNYDYSKAKLIVFNRKIELEKIKEQEEKLAKLQQENEKVEEVVNKVLEEQEVVAPTEIVMEQEETTDSELLEISFTAYMTKEQAKELAQWFKERNIKYE